MSKEPTKKDLYWILEMLVEQFERSKDRKDLLPTHFCVLCGNFHERFGHLSGCAYDAAKLALERRKK